MSGCWSCWFDPRSYLGSGHGRTHGTFCPAFLPHCWDKQWWLASKASSCPFRLVLGGCGFRGKAGRGSTSFPVQRAELCARVGLVAIGSFCGHEEADEPACTKTLGVVGLVRVQDVWHLMVDARIPWDQYLTLLNVHAHPACAGLQVGTASTEQR